MNLDAQTLLNLLPAFYRLQDAAIAEELGLEHGPLHDLLALFAAQVALIEEDLEQLQDDAFIETCADWAVPYIGDLIGYRPLHGAGTRAGNPRAEVAHTLAYRRRKGTLAVLEQLARDVTGYEASAVEYFQRLIVSQYMNHPRPWCHAAPDLRDWRALERVDSAFDTIPRSIDVRRISSGRGKHNIPNVGLFLWPLSAHGLHYAAAAPLDARRWRFSALGHDLALITLPQTEDDMAGLATPLHVPRAIARRVLYEDQRAATAGAPSSYYSQGAQQRSLRLYVGTDEPLPRIAYADVCVCHLGDDGADWAHLPEAGKYAVDPQLGRIALPPGLPADTRVRVDYHHAFGADLGGGSYPRSASFSTGPVRRVPQDHSTVQSALDALAGAGIVEISDSSRYEEALSIEVAAGQRIELRAADGEQPLLQLTAPLQLRGSGGGERGEIVLNGLLIAGNPLEVPAAVGNSLGRLSLRHCTLVPGLALSADATPQFPQQPSLIVELADTVCQIERCIVGALRVHNSATLRAVDSVLDATAMDRVAYAAPDGDGPGGKLSLVGCSSVGKLHAMELELVSNSLLLAELAKPDSWAAPILAVRRQQGCVRYSYLAAAARTPRRHRCIPGEDTTQTPVLRMASLRYGTPLYLQLGQSASVELRRGADDEGEVGVYHHVQRPQREANLALRLDEYLRVGLEAGVFPQF